ncbi:MAG: hypothetical protein ACYTFG_18570, partial [Planctomycetota bacterium]
MGLRNWQGTAGVILTLLICVTSAEADEIRLKNGNVLEGKIISETPEEVVIECDFGKITVRRSTIESIKRFRRPGASREKPSSSPYSAGPPPGMVSVPDSNAFFKAPSGMWSKSAEGKGRELVYRYGNIGILGVRAMKTPGGAKGSFMDFVHSYKKEFLPDAVFLQEKPYLHGGRSAYELAHERPRIPGSLTREYLVDHGEKKILVRLVGNQKRINECVPGYLALLDSLGVPELKAGKPTMGRPFEVRTPLVTVSHQPPVGPWEFKNAREESVHQLTYFRQGQGLIVVNVGFWDGHGKLAIHFLRSFDSKLRALDLNRTVVKNERTHDMGARVEYMGVGPPGKLAAIEARMETIKDSVKITKHWTDATMSENWRESAIKGAGIRFSLPKWWKGARGGFWQSPGGSAVHVSGGRLSGFRPSLADIQKFLATRDFQEYKDLRVLSADMTELKDAKGIKVVIGGNYVMDKQKFEVHGELHIYFKGDSFIQLITMA